MMSNEMFYLQRSVRELEETVFSQSRTIKELQGSLSTLERDLRFHLESTSTECTCPPLGDACPSCIAEARTQEIPY